MAKMSAKGAVIMVDDSGGTPRNISTDCVAFELKQDAGKIDITGFTEGAVNYIPGMPVYDITLDVKYNSAADTGAWTVLRGIFLSATSKTVSITPEPGGLTWTGEYMCDGIPLKGEPKGDLQIGSVTFAVMGSAGGSWAS